MKDKRRKERVESKLFVQIRSSADHSALGRGVVLDVSLSGISVETEAALALNDNYICDIEIPITLKARVVRGSGMGRLKKFGLMFEGQSFFDKLLLKRLIKGNQKHTQKI